MKHHKQHHKTGKKGKHWEAEPTLRLAMNQQLNR
jgi:hypothetical protein